ncbi:MAG: T9SS type A sorting domain-containing protein [Candidatus Cloacimonadales bacterium]|nr:T9SS type A sorting domain-containing protein [Candidatus Cloacimonadales bacterium]
MMKKTSLILGMMLILLLAFSANLIAGIYSSGSGTSVAPYQIANKADLLELCTTTGDWSKYFKQTEDINFITSDFGSEGDFYNAGAGFSPIGNNSINFTGFYDGQGYTIDGLFINRSSTDDIGLFGITGSSTIQNLGVTAVNITGNNHSGGLVGKNQGTISNSYITGSVSGGSSGVGGIVGYHLYSNISNSYNTGSVSGGNAVGGLVGNQNYGVISNSYSTGSVNVNGGSFIGGFVGMSTNGTVSNCYSSGSVSGGLGFSGYNTSTISNSFWDTETSGQATSSGGTGKTTAEMKTQSTFTDAGWDFTVGTGIWAMSSIITYGGYPTLQWTNGYAIVPTSYQIATLPNLVWVAESSARWAASYTQTADIDASSTSTWDGGAGWTPIGNEATNFAGSYDGQGHTIDGLFINRPSTGYIGLFGSTSSSTIQNLGVTGVNITGQFNVGGLVGFTDGGTVSSCYSTGSVIGTSNNVGGLVGNNKGTFNNCYSTSSVSGAISDGGLVGTNSDPGATVSNCYSTGSVSGSSSVGGLVGLTISGTTSNSFWDTQTSGQATSSGGTGKNTADMKTLSTFTNAGWDFKGIGPEGIWNIGNGRNSGYPYLDWQYPGDAPLPVTLSSFTASYSNNVAVLNWTTQSETDNLGFNLYRSEEANGFADENFIQINSDLIPGMGTTFTPVNYEFTDEYLTLEGHTYYYWLQSVSTSNELELFGPASLFIPQTSEIITELNEFQVEFQNYKPLLSWTTSTEVDNLGFYVHRSLDQNGFVLGDVQQLNGSIIPGMGNTAYTTNYSYLDQSTILEGLTYYYWLQSMDYTGRFELFGPVSLEIPFGNQLPTMTILQANYPNPFNPETTIEFNIKENEKGILTIYNLKGQRILKETFEAGNHKFVWNAEGLASGIYFYKLSSLTTNITRKMILMK